ncbi:hypothetical protein EDD16DRAFT_1471432 [Pisolithus croceorrhizus]|nr:hypothetical protein EDD16DRAFT_1471432 [Pisolithus croceorrhizus]KAI6169677.1 hypothetical protein EDD17DRAFT_1464449 [Pisolithus thermaeus]
MINAGPLWQNSLYIGNILSTILYGVQLALCCQTVHCSLGESSDSLSLNTPVTRRCLSGLLLLLSSIVVLVQAVLGQEMWIIHYDYNGGMEQYYADHTSVWYQILGLIAMVGLQLSSDALFIHRLYILWERIWVLVPPYVLWVATVVLGALLCAYSATQRGNIFTGEAAHIAIAYYAVVIVLNLLVTSTLCGRIWIMAWRIRSVLGPDYSRRYFCVVLVIIASALPRTAIGIAFLVTLALDSGVSVAFLSLYVMLTCVSSQMLILRAALGFPRDHASHFVPETSLKFCSPPISPATPRPPLLLTLNQDKSKTKEDICISPFDVTSDPEP